MRGNLVKLAISTALSKGLTIPEINKMEDHEIQGNKQIPNKLKHVLITLKNSGDLIYYETEDPESDWVIANRLANQFQDPELIDQYVKEQEQKEKGSDKINKSVNIAGRNITITEDEEETEKDENVITDDELKEMVSKITKSSLKLAVEEMKPLLEGKIYDDMKFVELIQGQISKNFKQAKINNKKERQAKASAVKETDTKPKAKANTTKTTKKSTKK